MSSIQIALIRGINVGKAKRVAMADLRALAGELGFGEVRTLLNSGNLVFTSRTAPKSSAAKLEKALAAQLGVSARITVLTAAELADIVGENPLGKVAKDPSRMLVYVLYDPADRAKLKPLAQAAWGAEALAVGTRVVYAWCAHGILDSPLPEALQRALGDRATARNWTTMTKLHALAQGAREEA